MKMDGTLHDVRVDTLQLPLDQIKSHINNMDFSLIIDKMVRSFGWEQKQAIKVCQFYKNFLFLISKYGDQYPDLPPSEEIDEFWHNHILDTKRYAEDSMLIFGRFLHHYPYQAVTTISFEQLQELHFHEFGDYVYKVRKKSLFYVPNLLFNLLNKFYQKMSKSNKFAFEKFN